MQHNMTSMVIFQTSCNICFVMCSFLITKRIIVPFNVKTCKYLDDSFLKVFLFLIHKDTSYIYTLSGVTSGVSRILYAYIFIHITSSQITRQQLCQLNPVHELLRYITTQHEMLVDKPFPFSPSHCNERLLCP